MMDKPVVVIGGGVAGIQASLDLADRGLKVHLVEKSPSIGGVMAQLDKTFPTMDCSICILAPKMIECFRHPNITIHTLSQVKEVTGKEGNFDVKVLKEPRSVDESKCTGCGLCSEKCPTKVSDDWQKGLSERKAIYILFPQPGLSSPTSTVNNASTSRKGYPRSAARSAPRVPSTTSSSRRRLASTSPR